MNEEQMLLAFIENLIKRAKTQHFTLHSDFGYSMEFTILPNGRDTFSITFTDNKDPE